MEKTALVLGLRGASSTLKASRTQLSFSGSRVRCGSEGWQDAGSWGTSLTHTCHPMSLLIFTMKLKI